jgi:hypothetical protein
MYANAIISLIIGVLLSVYLTIEKALNMQSSQGGSGGDSYGRI